MKKHNLTTLLLLALISFYCNGQAKKDTKSSPSSTTSASVVGKRIDGDFDGDKIIESAFSKKMKVATRWKMVKAQNMRWNFLLIN